MSEDPRIALVERAFRNFNESDLQGIVDFIDPAVRTHVAEGLINIGDWEGWAGFVEMSQGWNDVWGEVNYVLTGLELLDETNMLASVHQEATGAGSGVPVELDVVYLIEIVDARAVRFEVHPSRESALSRV